jgi:hypothetical protein
MAKNLSAIHRPVFMYTMPDWPRPRDDQTANMEARRTAPRDRAIDVLTIYSARSSETSETLATPLGAF